MSATFLTLKDILHYSHTGYNPLTSYKSYDFPRDLETNPLHRSFTFEEFKAFWHNERNASHWNYFSEENSRFYSKLLKDKSFDHPLPAPATKSRGRPREYDWSVLHVCKRGTQVHELKISRESTGQLCQVKIRIQKPVNEEKINVIYYWGHNHSIFQNTRAPLGKNDSNWAWQKVQEGHSLLSVKNILKPSNEQLDLYDKTWTGVPSALFLLTVQFENLRSVYYRKRLDGSQMSGDIPTSVKAWISHIVEKGGKGEFYDGNSEFMVCWSTKFQLK
ncbi:hypothetical protein BGZ49_005237, partial [Haplosporangium sp. Z 27]